MLLEQFMNESFDPFGMGYNYDVEPTNEGYDFNNGGFEIALQECEADSSKLNMADIVAEYQSCKLISEGAYNEAMILQENVIKTFFEKIKQIILAMWRKMKEIMQTVVLYFTKLTNDTKFITQIKKALNQYNDFTDLEVEGFEYTLDAIDPLSAYNAMNKKLYAEVSSVAKEIGVNISESTWLDEVNFVFPGLPGDTEHPKGEKYSTTKGDIVPYNKGEITSSNKNNSGYNTNSSSKSSSGNSNAKASEEIKLKLADLNQKLEDATNDDAVDKIISAGFSGCTGKSDLNDYLFKTLRSGSDTKEKINFNKSDCIKAVEGYKKALASVKNIENQVNAVHKKALSSIDKAKANVSKLETNSDNEKVIKSFHENVYKKLATMVKDNLTYTNTAIAAKNAAIKEERSQAKSMLMKAYNQAKKNQKETMQSNSVEYGNDVLGQLMSKF